MSDNAITSTPSGGDVIIAEGNPVVTRESKDVSNSTGSDVTLPAGHPMDDNVMCTSANIANADGIVCQETDIPDGETVKVPVLARGPAAINQDALPEEDYAGTAIVLASFVSAIETNTDIVVRSEPSEEEVQTT